MALAERIPIIEKLTSKFVALGPSVHAYLSRSRIVKTISNSNVISLLENLEVKEVLKNSWFFSALEGYICQMFDFLCKEIMQ